MNDIYNTTFKTVLALYTEEWASYTGREIDIEGLRQNLYIIAKSNSFVSQYNIKKLLKDLRSKPIIEFINSEVLLDVMNFLANKDKIIANMHSLTKEEFLKLIVDFNPETLNIQGYINVDILKMLTGYILLKQNANLSLEDFRKIGEVKDKPNDLSALNYVFNYIQSTPLEDSKETISCSDFHQKAKVKNLFFKNKVKKTY